MLLDYLNAHGVDTRYVRVIEQPTGHAVIQVEPQGNNCILLFGGANRCVQQYDIEDVIGQFGKGDYLVLQNEVNRIEEMMEAAKQRGMAVVFNPSPIADNLNNIRLEQIDWLILNEVEAREICGERGEADVVGTLRRMFPHAHVVLTLGERGAVYAYGGDVIRQDACLVKAVDTTAAGDTFTGFFVAAIAAGAAVGEAMRDASRAAAIAVTRPGASASIPRAEEVRAARQALGLPEA